MNNRTMPKIINYLYKIPGHLLEDPPQTIVFAHDTPMHYQDYTFNLAFIRNNLSLVFTGNGRISFELFIQENGHTLVYKRKNIAINGNTSYGGTSKILQKSLAQCVEKDNLKVRLRLGVDISCPVCGKVEDLRDCAACNSVSYCCKEHQRQHWPTHKPDCCKKRTDKMAAYLRRINSWEKSGVLTVEQRDKLKESLSECPESVHESLDQLLVMQEVMEKKASEIFDLMEDLTQKKFETVELKKDIQLLNVSFERCTSELQKRNHEIAELKGAVKKRNKKLAVLNDKRDELEGKLAEMKIKMKLKNSQLKNLEGDHKKTKRLLEDLDVKYLKEVSANGTLFFEVKKLKEENEKLLEKLKTAKMKPLEAQSVAELHLTLKRVSAELEEREYQENCCQCCGECPRISHAMIPCGHRFCSECVEMDVCPFCSSKKTATLKLY